MPDFGARLLEVVASDGGLEGVQASALSDVTRPSGALPQTRRTLSRMRRPRTRGDGGGCAGAGRVSVSRAVVDVVVDCDGDLDVDEFRQNISISMATCKDLRPGLPRRCRQPRRQSSCSCRLEEELSGVVDVDIDCNGDLDVDESVRLAAGMLPRRLQERSRVLAFRLVDVVCGLRRMQP